MKITSSHSTLSAEASAFNVWQLSEEQLFIQLQNINTSMQSIKYQSENIIAPKLIEINTSLLLYQTSPQLLYLPQNHLLNIRLQQQRFNLQQQYVQNQQIYQQLQQQLKSTQALYHRIKNDPNQYQQPYNEPIVEHKEEEEEIEESTADIALESQCSLNCSPSASIYTTEESTISHISPSEAISTVSKQAVVSICYDVKSLIGFQAENTKINWRKHKNIPLCIRFISQGINNETYMQDVVAMFERKASNPWLAPSHVGNQPVDELERLQKRLRGILNKMTPDKFDKIAAQTMDVMQAFGETQDQMRAFIHTILQFVIEIPVFADQYARLCRYLYDAITNDNLRKTFREIVILQTNDLFKRHRKYSVNDSALDFEDAQELEMKRIKLKTNFFAVMRLVAELYNVELITFGVIHRGLFEILLPPKNKQLTAIDIEGLCCLLQECGQRLDANGSKRYVDKYLKQLLFHAKKFDFRTRVIVDEIKGMRTNEWKQRIKKEIARTKEEIRNEFESNYAKTHPQKYKNHYQDTHDRKRHNNRYSSTRIKYQQVAKSSEASHKRQPVRYNDDDNKSNSANNEQKLRSLIDEYLISGVMDDILCLYKECDDFSLWSHVINDGLRDRKCVEMERFIAFILELFEHNVLNNECAMFINVVVDHLAVQLDDSSIDCPLIMRYIAQLFAHLCYHQYLFVDDVFEYFIQKYIQHSQYLLCEKKKNINKLIKYSIEKLKQLQASQRLIAKINKYSM